MLNKNTHTRLFFSSDQRITVCSDVSTTRLGPSMKMPSGWRHSGMCFLRRDISVICVIIVLKLAVTVFTSLHFQTFWPTSLYIFGHFKNISVLVRKMTENQSRWNSVAMVVGCGATALSKFKVFFRAMKSGQACGAEVKRWHFGLRIQVYICHSLEYASQKNFLAVFRSDLSNNAQCYHRRCIGTSMVDVWPVGDDKKAFWEKRYMLARNTFVSLCSRSKWPSMARATDVGTVDLNPVRVNPKKKHCLRSAMPRACD